MSPPARRFVILEHDHPFLHWDLMLERDASLRTWRLAGPPASGESVEAEPIADHRVMYLDYEGPVSQNRGSVRRWDHGTYQQLDDKADRFQLNGETLNGTLRIRDGVAVFDEATSDD